MSIEKSHFFDQIGAALTSFWPVFEACRSNRWGDEGQHGDFRSPSAHGILRPAKIGREENSMIRLEACRSEQVRFAAGFLAVTDLASKVLARQRARTCACSLRAGRRYGSETPAKQVATDGLQQKRNS
jgi:hypothetical protein